MTTRFPPRYLPTLTEVVSPHVRDALVRVAAPVVQTEPVAYDSPPVAAALPDRDTLARQVIALVRPQLEGELRTVALELFEAQYSALLPSLQLQIEEAVREAIDLALPDPADHGN
jgi:hypothetical protein